MAVSHPVVPTRPLPRIGPSLDRGLVAGICSPAERCKRRWRKSTRDTWRDPRSTFSELRSSRMEPPSSSTIDDAHHITMQKNLGLCGLSLRSRLKGCRIELPGLFEKVIANVAIRHRLCNHHGPRH